MSEMFDTISANAEQAAEREREQFAEAEALLAKREALNEQRRQLRRKKATRALVLRLVSVAVVLVGLFLSLRFELMAWQLVVAVAAGVIVWGSVWTGAWMQFMFADGGVLHASK